jgi:hypothetical protein
MAPTCQLLLQALPRLHGRGQLLLQLLQLLRLRRQLPLLLFDLGLQGSGQRQGSGGRGCEHPALEATPAAAVRLAGAPRNRARQPGRPAPHTCCVSSSSVALLSRSRVMLVWLSSCVRVTSMLLVLQPADGQAAGAQAG